MRVCMEKIHREVFDPLERPQLLHATEEGAGTIDDQSVSLAVVRKDVGDGFFKDTIPLRLVHSLGPQDPLIFRVYDHKPSMAVWFDLSTPSWFSSVSHDVVALHADFHVAVCHQLRD